MVTILIFDRQSLCQASILTRLSLLLPESTRVADCATEAELARHITDNPGATLFLGQISFRSEAMQLARQLSDARIQDPESGKSLNTTTRLVMAA